ncbi:SDR family NAD(P)-dependent oxidoreductase [Vreelandella malpeensis]|uniref:SDR family NAD(P)-dependent oxidoreductase n=1 Tax=Vreelandella malpeensis TaxID=1172368 RepID=A0ABS8DQL8_9GAMM|nr:SDR family NAD(P)-dependent oxidoreductase [Halomonas malpeensis]MCB8888535.1 SDR family NAD(P)-dependent oxidoreductase [Halomonas malpeensis]
MLDHLPDGFTALVTGAGGGIGSAVVEALLNSPRVGQLLAVSRTERAYGDERVTPITADITTEEGIDTVARALENHPLHLLFNGVGTLHDHEHDIAPEKRLEQFDASAFARVMHVNAATPLRLLAALNGSLKGSHPCIVASLSARVGSIGDNGFGGWYSYRASKAAHNMLMKTAAIELARINSQAIVLCLHPGTTDTSLSRPFQARVPEDKLFTPAFVAERLLAVIDQRCPEDTGSFWDWAGEPIEW